MPFKLPYIYTERVFALATPPFHPNYGYEALSNRMKTPPYLSTTSDIFHVRANTTTTRLILASDGLMDIVARTRKSQSITEALKSWNNGRSATFEKGTNLATDLLFDLLDGQKEDGYFPKFFMPMPGRRVDDTTTLVLDV